MDLSSMATRVDPSSDCLASLHIITPESQKLELQFLLKLLRTTKFRKAVDETFFIKLRDCENLIELNLSYNALDDDFLNELAKVLPKLKKLEKLHLLGNKYDEEGVCSIVDAAIQKCSSIKTIYFDNFSPAVASHIVGAFFRAKRKTLLEFGDDSLSKLDPSHPDVLPLHEEWRSESLGKVLQHLVEHRSKEEKSPTTFFSLSKPLNPWTQSKARKALNEESEESRQILEKNIKKLIDQIHDLGSPDSRKVHHFLPKFSEFQKIFSTKVEELRKVIDSILTACAELEGIEKTYEDFCRIQEILQNSSQNITDALVLTRNGLRSQFVSNMKNFNSVLRSNQPKLIDSVEVLKLMLKPLFDSFSLGPSSPFNARSKPEESLAILSSIPVVFEDAFVLGVDRQLDLLASLSIREFIDCVSAEEFLQYCKSFSSLKKIICPLPHELNTSLLQSWAFLQDAEKGSDTFACFPGLRILRDAFTSIEKYGDNIPPSLTETLVPYEDCILEFEDSIADVQNEMDRISRRKIHPPEGLKTKLFKLKLDKKSAKKKLHLERRELIRVLREHFPERLHSEEFSPLRDIPPSPLFFLDDFEDQEPLRHACGILKAKLNSKAYALKPYALLGSPDVIDREKEKSFYREAKVLLDLKRKHENIIELFAIAECNDSLKFYLVFPLYPFDLDQYMHEKGSSVPPVARLVIGKKVLSGINFLHSNRIAHGDIKPSNIFLCENGTTVVVADFDASVDLSRTMTESSYPGKCTPRFASPEALRNPSAAVGSLSSDMFSFGATMHWLLCFGHDEFCVEFCFAQERDGFSLPEVCSQLPEAKSLICQKLLSFEPEERPEAIDALCSPLFEFVSRFPSSSSLLLLPPVPDLKIMADLKELVEGVMNDTVIAPADADAVAFKVLSVDPIENGDLWKKYAAFKSCLTTSVPHSKFNWVATRQSPSGKTLYERLGLDPGELLLFHGTSYDAAQTISEGGFDPRIASDGYFGFGSYFAESISKAHQYSNRVLGPDGPYSIMVLCLVLMGSSSEEMEPTPHVTRPRCTEPGCLDIHCRKHGVRHDSVIARKDKSLSGVFHDDFTEFIVHKGEQVYPLAIVRYHTC